MAGASYRFLSWRSSAPKRGSRSWRSSGRWRSCSSGSNSGFVAVDVDWTGKPWFARSKPRDRPLRPRFPPRQGTGGNASMVEPLTVLLGLGVVLGVVAILRGVWELSARPDPAV